MNKNDFEFLKFRTDLIELLNKYNYELSGTGFDDGTIDICDGRSGKSYMISDSLNYYQVYSENFVEEYIINLFRGNEESGFHNKKIGVFSNDYYKILNFFADLQCEKRREIDFYKSSKETQEIKLLDGTRYIWIKPIANSRGHRVGKAYIDKNLTLNELHYIVEPICVCCKYDDVEVI